MTRTLLEGYALFVAFLVAALRPGHALTRPVMVYVTRTPGRRA